MAHSIEARLPYLDYRLVELMFSLEPQQLIRNGHAKVILRDALADLLPERVRERTDKMGFQTPEARWLAGPLAPFAKEVLTSPESRGRGYVNVDAAQASLRRQGERAWEAGSPLWRAVSLELWAQTFLDRPLPAPA
jgi:asparagine synthase (glutamine-hydrolysing)